MLLESFTPSVRKCGSFLLCIDDYPSSFHLELGKYPSFSVQNIPNSGFLCEFLVTIVNGGGVLEEFQFCSHMSVCPLRWTSSAQWQKVQCSRIFGRIPRSLLTGTVTG